MIALIPAGTASAAISDAPPGETIVVPAGTYTLTSDELTVEKSLTISGHAPGDTIIQSGSPFRVFDIGGAGNNVTISGSRSATGASSTRRGCGRGRASAAKNRIRPF